MHSIREVFVIGHGPSSSHTMGPAFACDYVRETYPEAKNIRVTLYDSLALTGKGHLTDYIIDLKLRDIPHQVVFDKENHKKHPNTMLFEITGKDGSLHEETILSVGGGSIRIRGKKEDPARDVYELNLLSDIVKHCNEKGIGIADYVLEKEGPEIRDYLESILTAMEAAKKRGIATPGTLPGKLHVQRKAPLMYENMMRLPGGKENVEMNMAIASFAVSEENASGGIVAIAPTCGSAGVLPGVLTYLEMNHVSRENILRGMETAGIIGMLARTNASVSGAECGCQAEIGVACAMGAALVSAATGNSNNDIAQAAEIAMEHSLGLTCDPVDGYVQIPCIERCAIFAMKAVNAANLAKIVPWQNAKVGFDESLQTMYLTGKDLKSGYRETAKSGLARIVK